MKPNPRKKPQTKAEKRLEDRLKGYSDTINAPHNRGKDMKGIHRPGSMKK